MLLIDTRLHLLFWYVWEWLNFTHVIYVSHRILQYPSHCLAEKCGCVYVCVCACVCARSCLCVSAPLIWLLHRSWSIKSFTNTLCPNALDMQWRAQIPGNQRRRWCLQNLHWYAWEQELAYNVIAAAAKVSAFAQAVNDIKARMYTQHLGFLYGNLHAFWRRRMTLPTEVSKIDENLPLIVSPPKFFMLSRVRLEHYSAALSGPLLGLASPRVFHAGSKAVYRPARVVLFTGLLCLWIQWTILFIHLPALALIRPRGFDCTSKPALVNENWRVESLSSHRPFAIFIRNEILPMSEIRHESASSCGDLMYLFSVCMVSWSF